MLWLISLALATDPAPAEEITVWGEPEVREAHEAVVQALDEKGYTRIRTRRGRDVFVHSAPWKPKVKVDRDGYAFMRRRNVVWVGPDGSAERDRSRLDYGWCLLYPPACISTRGMQVSTRKLDGERRRVMASLEAPLGRYRDAVSDKAFRARLEVELPAQLRRLWEDGVGPDGGEYASLVERRDAIVAMAAGRTTSDHGARARMVIVAFLVDHVQDTPLALPDERVMALLASPSAEPVVEASDELVPAAPVGWGAAAPPPPLLPRKSAPFSDVSGGSWPGEEANPTPGIIE
jgi:hypothetical protein